MNKNSNFLWGIVLIALGTIFGLNALDITDIDIFFKGWWTLFIIVPCFIDLFKDEDKTGNIIGLIIGVGLLLSAQDIITFEVVWKLFVPVVLIVIGLSFIFKDRVNNKIKKQIKKLNKNDDKEYFAAFGGQTLDFKGEKFDGCSLNAIFGGVKCDLKGAILEDNAVINASSIFGGITIYLPKDVEVKVVSTPIFGGVSNHIKNRDCKKTVYVNATCLFGGVEIK